MSPADGVDHLVLMNDSSGIEVLPSSCFRALGIAVSDMNKLLRPVVVLVPLVLVRIDLIIRSNMVVFV